MPRPVHSRVPFVALRRRAPWGWPCAGMVLGLILATGCDDAKKADGASDEPSAPDERAPEPAVEGNDAAVDDAARPTPAATTEGVLVLTADLERIQGSWRPLEGEAGAPKTLAELNRGALVDAGSVAQKVGSVAGEGTAPASGISIELVVDEDLPVLTYGQLVEVARAGGHQRGRLTIRGGVEEIRRELPLQRTDHASAEEVIVARFDVDGVVELGAEAGSPAELGPALDRLLESRPDPVLFVQASPWLTMGQLFRQLEANDARKKAVISVDPAPPPPAPPPADHEDEGLGDSPASTGSKDAPATRTLTAEQLMAESIYTPAPRLEGSAGKTVKVELCVGGHGRVTRVKVLGATDAELKAAVETALAKWRFRGLRNADVERCVKHSVGVE